MPTTHSVGGWNGTVMTLAISKQSSVVEEEGLYQEDLVPCLTPGTTSSSSSECSTESAWKLIKQSPKGQMDLLKCSAPNKKRRQLDYQVDTVDCITVRDVLSVRWYSRTSRLQQFRVR